MKLGFFGGSFDPIHHGHLIAAQDVREQLGMERVIFVPSFRSPLKESGPGISAEERVGLLDLAVAEVPGFSVSTIEIERGGVSYTLDTVLELKKRYHADDFFWIIGADQVALLSQWSRIEDLAGEVTFAAVPRPGASWVSAPAGVKLCPVDSHLCDISSTEIRDRVRQGRSIRFLAPPQVVSRIIERNLYRG